MSFLLTELSARFGSPYELYEFVNGPSTWRYTSDRRIRTLTDPDREFTPRAIKRSGIEQSREFSRTTMSLTVPRDFPVALLYVTGSPEGVMQLTLYRGHDRDTDEQIATYWTGRVVGVAFKGSTATMKCDTAYTGMQSNGKRATHAVQCRHSLYKTGCNVNRELFKVAGTMAVVSGLTYQAAAFATKPDGWFNNGTLEIVVNGQIMRRLIVAHAGSTVTLMSTIYGAAAGNAFEAFAGCARGPSTCNDKFSNIINYGGFPWKPVKNPFTGDSVY